MIVDIINWFEIHQNFISKR